MSIKKLLLLVIIAIPLATAAVAGIYIYRHLPLKTAAYYVQAGDLEAANDSLDDFLLSNPTDPYGLSLKAQIQCRRQEFESSIAIYREIGPAGEQDFKCFVESLFSVGQWENVVSVANAYKEKFGPDPEVLVWAAISQCKIEDWSSALDYSLALGRIQGFEAESWALQADCQVGVGNWAKAFEAWGKATELNPKATGLHVAPAKFFENYAKHLIASGRIKETIHVIEDVAEVKLTPQLHFLLGKAFKAAGNVEQAKKQWVIANRSSLHIESHLELARQLLREEKIVEAFNTVEPIKSSNRVDANVASLMVTMCEKVGDPERTRHWKDVSRLLEVREQIEQRMNYVAKHSPPSSKTRIIRAYFSAKQGEWGQARQDFDSVDFEDRATPFGTRLEGCIFNQVFEPQILELLDQSLSVQ